MDLPEKLQLIKKKVKKKVETANSPGQDIADSSRDVIGEVLDEDDLNKKAENLRKAMEKIYDKIKIAMSSKENCELLNNIYGTDIPKEENIVENNELSEINEKLDKIIDILSNNCNSDVKNLLNQILEKLDSEKENVSNNTLNQILNKVDQLLETNNNDNISETMNLLLDKLNILIEKNQDYSAKIDNVLAEIDKLLTKMDVVSERTIKLLENGDIKVSDIIKLIKEIYNSIEEIKDILRNLNPEKMDKAMNIVDNLNNELDNYVGKIESDVEA